MLKRYRQWHTRLHQLMDSGLVALALWVSHFIRYNWDWGRPIFPFQDFLWLFLILMPLAPVVLSSQGFYNHPLVVSRRVILWPLLRSCVILTVCLILGMFFFREQLARMVFILFGIISFVFIFVKEEVLRRVYMSRLGQEHFRKRIILAGSSSDTSRLRETLKAESHGTLHVVAEIDLNARPVEELVQMLHDHSANGVIFNAKHMFFGNVEKAIQACELEGVEAWLIADFFKMQTSRTTLDDFCGIPVLVFRSAPDISWQALGKQAIDYAGGLALLFVSAPLFVLVPIVIKLTSPGPVFFRQQRCGLNGRPFTMLKFRSMVTNAEQQRHELEALNEMSGPVFKVTADPRVTKTGRFLRKYSLDEFPQLINVLKGEMSLVGPRPLPVSEVERFDDLAHRRRLSVKPGLTCLWQISGRNEVKDFRDWVRLDLEYIDNWSLALDIKILWRTIPVVLIGTGAK